MFKILGCIKHNINIFIYVNCLRKLYFELVWSTLRVGLCYLESFSG